MRTIHNAGGMGLVNALGTKVENPGEIGCALSRLNLIDSPQESEFLRRQFNSPDESSVLLGIGYLRERFNGSDWSWVEDLYSNEVSQWPDTSYLLFLLQLPYTFHTWTWVERRGHRVEAEYWSSIRLLRLRDSGHYLHAVNKMLEHGLSRSAVIMLGIMHSDVGIENQESLVIEVLDCAAARQRHPAIDQSRFATYTSMLLDFIDNSEGVAEDSVARLEWIYCPLLDPEYRKSKRLNHLLTNDPVFFAEIVSLVCQRPDAHGRQTAVGRELIVGMKKTPCQLEDGSCDPEALSHWVETAQQELAARGCRDNGDRLIGMSLAYGTEESDGFWPQQAVRDILRIAEFGKSVFEKRLHNRHSRKTRDCCQVVARRRTARKGIGTRNTIGTRREFVISGL